MLVMEMTSGQRVKRSTQVRRYVNPRDGGRGPTRLMLMASNGASEVQNEDRGALECLGL